MCKGFYGTLPRIVRTDPKYKHLTSSQILFYVYLRDMCGDTGICYKTIEALAEETNISARTISTAMGVLRDAGLIRAQEKGRTSLWHLSIVDIWEENAAAHPCKPAIPTPETQKWHLDLIIRGKNIDLEEVKA